MQDFLPSTGCMQWNVFSWCDSMLWMRVKSGAFCLGLDVFSIPGPSKKGKAVIKAGVKSEREKIQLVLKL